MKYRNGNSLLGLGCMRFPRNVMKIIDQEKTNELLQKAIDSGINYFDTAYIYPGSEVAIGKFLKTKYKGKREDINIVTKLPQYMIRKESDFDKYLYKSKERLEVEYIDYFLLHMMADEKRLEELLDLGLHDWVEEKKKSGIIKKFGFSFHGRKEEFKKLIDAYNWDITMIQYNYLDESNQAGKDGLKYAYSKGISVVCMEPLRGGTLSNKLPKDVVKLFKDKRPDLTPTAWALKWIENQKEISTILSGMTYISDIEENVRTINMIEDLSKEELQVIEEAKKIINEKTKVPCTGCGYCMPCPFGVDIPTCFSTYNDKYTIKTKETTMIYIRNTAAYVEKPANSGVCTSCGACVKHCPQKIDIPKELKIIKNKLEGIRFKLIVFVMKMIKKKKK